MSPATVFHARRDDEKPSSGGMIVRQANLPAEVRKPDAFPVQTADEVIAEIAAKVALYKPKPEWEGMSAEEMYKRAGVYYVGGALHDWTLAAKWLRRAAEQGHAKAQHKLGGMYHVGERYTKGVPQDYAEAVKWYRRAAEQGHAYAQGELGDMYCKGEGVPKNYAESIKWYRRAAEQGNPHAQSMVDRAEAEYRRAAEEGNPHAPQDYAEAVKWYRRGAEQRDDEA